MNTNIGTNNYWHTLKSNFMDSIKIEIVNPRYHKDFSRSIDLLIEYAVANECAEYSPEMGYAFVEHEKTQGYRGNTSVDRRRKTIKRLNEYLYGTTFWQRTPRNLREYRKPRTSLQCPEQFSEVFGQFLQSISKEGLKEITVNQYRTLCIKMLLDFEGQGVSEWGDIDARILTAAFSRSTNKHHFVPYARRLFRYLMDVGVVAADYSGILPSLTKRKAIPSVYSEAEIQQLLDCVETVTPQGKRDYAIILLAVRLGLRASDIRNLRFENVDFDKARVQFIQFKTSVPHQLSLPAEVAHALRDYIDNGREESKEPHIFLDGYARPVSRHAVSHMVARNFKKTDIDFGPRHQGSHALRMTFASQLIAENVPYEAVRALLGQVDPSSTRHYVEFAIESLRTCALEIPPPSGRLEQYLANGGDA